MDTKTLAKSKRAHSLHHSKKNQHHQASKAPSLNTSAASGSKKPIGKQIEVKPQTLPSNWDRYGEEFDLDSESTSQLSEFVVRKSKGADYTHLLLEAQSQSQSSYLSDGVRSFSGFDDDFTQNFGALLSAKGKSILSWIDDDSFGFEGQSSNIRESDFLSLNFDALAKQLAKAKPSERLFIEPDILPPELLDEELEACGEENPDQVKSISAVELDSRVLSLNSGITMTQEIPVLTSKQRLKPMKHQVDELLGFEETHRTITPISKQNIDSASKSSHIFEAANAEAELDMLLNSFNEPGFFESSIFSQDGILSSASETSESVVMKPATMVSSFDDAVDLLVDGGRVPDGVKTITDIPSSTMGAGSKSQLMDDFDSWLDTI